MHLLDLDAPAREMALDNGNEFITLDPVEVARWKEAGERVVATWVEEMSDKGIDGAGLLETLKASVASYEG